MPGTRLGSGILPMMSVLMELQPREKDCHSTSSYKYDEGY